MLETYTRKCISHGLKRNVQKRSPLYHTSMDFRTHLQASWCELPPSYFETLAESMPRRAAALLHVLGSSERYVTIFFWFFSACEIIFLVFHKTFLVVNCKLKAHRMCKYEILKENVRCKRLIFPFSIKH